MLSLLRRTLLNKNPTSRLLLKCNQVRNINLQDFNVLQVFSDVFDIPCLRVI